MGGTTSALADRGAAARPPFRGDRPGATGGADGCRNGVRGEHGGPRGRIRRRASLRRRYRPGRYAALSDGQRDGIYDAPRGPGHPMPACPRRRGQPPDPARVAGSLLDLRPRLPVWPGRTDQGHPPDPLDRADAVRPAALDVPPGDRTGDPVDAAVPAPGRAPDGALGNAPAARRPVRTRG